MQKLKKLYLVLFTTLSITLSSYPIQQSTATFLSVASGAGAGLLTYYQGGRNIFSSTLTGAGAALFMYLIAREFTPERKFERAKSLLSSAERGLFVRFEYMSDRAFFDAMHTAYATDDLPYAVAYHDLTRRLNWLYDARLLFDEACEEANPTLVCLTRENQCRASDLIDAIIEAIKRIKKTKEFTKQLEIYEKRRLAEQLLAIEERKAAARESQARAEHNQAFAQHRQADAAGAW